MCVVGARCFRLRALYYRWHQLSAASRGYTCRKKRSTASTLTFRRISDFLSKRREFPGASPVAFSRCFVCIHTVFVGMLLADARCLRVGDSVLARVFISSGGRVRHALVTFTVRAALSGRATAKTAKVKVYSDQLGEKDIPIDSITVHGTEVTGGHGRSSRAMPNPMPDATPCCQNQNRFRRGLKPAHVAWH